MEYASFREWAGNLEEERRTTRSAKQGPTGGALRKVMGTWRACERKGESSRLSVAGMKMVSFVALLSCIAMSQGSVVHYLTGL